MQLRKELMHVEMFSLCEQAWVTTSKLNVSGVFDEIETDMVPFRHSGLTAVARVRFEPVEYGEKEYRVEFIDEDGNNVTPPQAGTISRNCWANNRSDTANIVVQYSGLQFPGYGSYELLFLVNDRVEAITPLEVRKTASETSFFDF